MPKKGKGLQWFLFRSNIWIFYWSHHFVWLAAGKEKIIGNNYPYSSFWCSTSMQSGTVLLFFYGWNGVKNRLLWIPWYPIQIHQIEKCMDFKIWMNQSIFRGKKNRRERIAKTVLSRKGEKVTVRGNLSLDYIRAGRKITGSSKTAKPEWMFRENGEKKMDGKNIFRC